MPECERLPELERVLELELVGHRRGENSKVNHLDLLSLSIKCQIRLQLYRLISAKTSSRRAKPQVIGSDLLHLLGPRARVPSFSSLPARRIFTSLINKSQ